MLDKKMHELFKGVMAIYNSTSSRSNKKLKFAHGFISDEIFNTPGVDITCLREDIKRSCEKTVKFENGYSKKMDIVGSRAGKAIYYCGTKFIFTNLLQNLNNYYESECGQAFNFSLGSDVPYFSLTFVLDEVPYKDKTGKVVKFEKCNSSTFEKYNNLVGKFNCYPSIIIYSPSKDTIVGTAGVEFGRIVEIVRSL